jgi:uncharacterized protein with FMN-binding domain
MANKASRRLVALSASAIATIYAAGFMLTRSADARLSGATGATAAGAVVGTAAPVVGTAATGSSSGGSTPVVGATASASTVAVSATQPSPYADGTYTGQGTSRRGGVSVSVAVQGGAITNVQITSANTEYPVSRIASLPSLVLKQQSANVNTISGATYSSLAFKQAVQQALTRAQTGATSLSG